MLSRPPENQLRAFIVKRMRGFYLFTPGAPVTYNEQSIALFLVFFFSLFTINLHFGQFIFPGKR